MALEQITDKVIDTDVLVVGGGIAGCPAAAKAAEHGLRVTLAEKAKIDRSGSAAQGIDHYGRHVLRDGMTPAEWTKLMEIHGNTVYYGGLPYTDPTRMYRQYANALWAIEELEKLGVTMRWDDGKLRFVTFGNGLDVLRVHWTNVKPEMAMAVRKRGVNVLERTMIIDLLSNGHSVAGATAIDTRTGEFIVIKAKAIVIATAACSRIYNPETPVPWKYKFRYHWCPASVSGDGWAMAYRAGAELANMEQSRTARRIRDDLNFSMGNFGNEGINAIMVPWNGEDLQRLTPSRFNELEMQGKDPFYFSLEHLPDDFQKRIEVEHADERLVSLKIAGDRGFNPRTHWYELMDNRPFELHTEPGIWTNASFETSVKGVYAIGDCVAGCHDVAAAATSGFLVGDSMRNIVSAAKAPMVDEDQVAEQKQAALAPLKVKDGTEPMELECAIRYLCTRYVGMQKSEGKLKEGLRRLGSLRRVFLPQQMAKNSHYLMRALEVRNLMDVAEVHMQACLERRETRGSQFRLDYKETNPIWDGMLLFQRLDQGKAVIEFKKPAKLNMEFRERR